MERLNIKDFGKSAKSSTETAHWQLPPQQPFFLFFESEQGFLQQFFSHFDFCVVLVFA
jgi:hypothetical protein